MVTTKAGANSYPRKDALDVPVEWKATGSAPAEDRPDIKDIEEQRYDYWREVEEWSNP